jgi:formylglycine-generating enzyme required for sulfatase activity/energy-coupling factor transporter ATP-binding protein EcfA2
MKHASADHPFPGLRSFELDDREYFFGRDEHIEALYKKLLLNRFVAVVGSSGSGKSSLVKAGLLGRISSSIGTVEGDGSNWRTIVMRPLGRPLWRLACAVVPAKPSGTEAVDEERKGASTDLETDRALARLSRSSVGLIELLRELPAGNAGKLLLIVDQFEELFRYAPIAADTNFDERALFVKHLLRAVSSPDLRIHVLITMRSEFVGDCAQFRDLPEAISDSQFLTPRLTRNDRKRAVLGPLQLAGGEIAPALLQKILNDSGQEPDQLPVMQHALMRSWQAGLPSRRLTLDTYAKIGGMESAVSMHAEGLLQRRTKAEGPPQQRTESEKLDIERIFRALTDVDEEGRATRRPTRFIEIAAQCSTPETEASLINTFRDEECAFLLPSRNTPLDDDTILDITHEALIRKWKTLTVWVTREAEDGKNILRLHDLATRRKTDPEFVLAPREAAERNLWWQESKPTAAWAARYLKGDDNVKFADIRELLEASVARAVRDAERISGLERQAKEARLEAEQLLREKAEREAREKNTELQLAQMARKLAETQRQKLASLGPLQSEKVTQTIFISYSSHDKKIAIEVYEWLVGQGFEDIFLDLDPDQAGGRSEKVITSARIVLLLISPKWAESRFCQRELQVARAADKQLMPILIEPIGRGGCELLDDLRHHFQLVNWGDSGAKERILARLRQLGLVEEYFPYVHGRSPYPGLTGFDEEDAAVFFGRSAQIIEAIDRLRLYRQGGGCHVLAILGASGSGKSSFLRAGLWARLKRDKSSFFCLPILRPHDWQWSEHGLDLWYALRLAVENEQTLDKEYKEQIEKQKYLGADQDGLLLEAELLAILDRLARELGPGADHGRVSAVLAIDQTEELVRTARRRGVPLLSQGIVELLERSNVPLTIIISIRSDCFEMLQADPILGSLSMEAFSLAPIQVGSFRDVIQGPARVAGIRIDPELVDTLINDAGNVADSLPLLSFTLERLYVEFSAAKVITLSNYEALGGFAGSIEAAIERALKSADSDPAVPRNRAARLALLRRGLIPWLAGIDPDTGAPRRRVARLSEIPAEARPLIAHLVEQRLLATDANRETNEATIEPAHDALLRQWGLLRGWLTEDAALLAVLEDVKRASRDWAAASRSRAWLSHQTDRLAAAERLSARPDLTANLNPTDQAYIAACRKAETDAKRGRRLLQGAIYVLLAGVIVGLVGWINQATVADEWRWWTVTRPYMASQVWPYVLTAAQEQALKPGASFIECAQDCPEMIVVPAGSFTMGSPATEKGRYTNEDPQHEVTIAKPFAVSKYELTFADWDACVTGGGCNGYEPKDQGWGRGQRPVINVSWDDAQKYVAWLSQVTGKTYRLLSEAEYEYAARAGTTTAYPWGDNIGQGNANCAVCGSQFDNKQAAPVGTFAPNRFSLYDMVGNVFQWVEDCWHEDYNGAPTDGSAWSEGGTCDGRVVRGGSWSSPPSNLRSAARNWISATGRTAALGIRVGRTLGP